MAGLLYANRELTYTPCLACPAARTLRAGGEARNALLQRRFSVSALPQLRLRLAGLGSRDNAGITERGFRNPPHAPNRSALRPLAT